MTSLEAVADRLRADLEGPVSRTEIVLACSRALVDLAEQDPSIGSLLVTSADGSCVVNRGPEMAGLLAESVRTLVELAEVRIPRSRVSTIAGLEEM